ncbi:siderophore-interacting protein [Pseudonocardia adelaidensis]|uniref:Siderophore-interacting protein n=1 Tax=Pseudonocardia adelaidensis TaxID=648754 RepID=A0ABP9NLB1_9PSEU
MRRRPPLPHSVVEVLRTRRVTPRMQRITFGGPDVARFAPVGPDQHVKLFFPRRPGGPIDVPAMPDDGDVGRWYGAYLRMPDEDRPWMRSYTIRAHDPVRAEIDVDFVLHGGADADADGGDGHAGPAAAWAATAAPGERLGMLGPQITRLREPGPHAWKLIAGDESVLPAIGALVESLGAHERAVVFVEVRDAAEEQELTSPGRVDLRWLHRGDLAPGASTALVDAVRAAELPEGPAFAWLAGEASVVRALRRHLVAERGIARRAVSFTGYWRLHRTQDDAPSEEEIAEQAEVLADAADSPATGARGTAGA